MEYHERLTAQDSARLAQLLDAPNQRRRERRKARIERAQMQLDAWLDIQARAAFQVELLIKKAILKGSTIKSWK